MKDPRSPNDPPAYALSTIHCRDREAPALLIARPHDDDMPTNSHLDSSIHFRDTLPSILYRIQGSRLVLTCLNTNYESTVFECGSPIQNVGIHDDGDNIMIYVLLKTCILYSMLLPPTYLENPRLKKEEGWINEYSPPSFQIRRPLYMHSISARNVIFSLADGGLLRLSQEAGYKEHIFTDSSYFASFKSILPWSGRPSNLIISMRHCLARGLLFTLSVDAKLKVWDLLKGQLLSVHDVVAPEQPLNFLLSPEPSSYLALHEHSGSYTLVTYCPQHVGLFKVFRGRGNNVEEIMRFSEEQPAEGLWRVFDVSIQEVKSDGSLVLHVLWKLDTLSMLQTAYIRSSQSQPLWNFAAIPVAAALPSTNAEAIEDFIFAPGRFSYKTIIEALASISAVELSSSHQPSRRHLRDLAHRTIHNSIQLQIEPETGTPLTEKRLDDIRVKYLNVAQIALELDRTEGEPHALLRCPFTGRTMISQTSKVSFVRSATALEKIVPLEYDPGNSDPITHVMQAAKILKEGLSSNSWFQVTQVFRDECLSDRTLSADDAMFVAYEKTIENQIPPATAAVLGQAGVHSQTILEGLQALLPITSAISMRRPIDKVLGIDAYVAEQRDTLATAREYMVYLLAYMLFVGCTWTDANLYRAAALYVRYMQAYKQLLLLDDTLNRTLLDVEQVNKSALLDISRVTLVDDDQNAQPQHISQQDTVVFQGLAVAYAGEIPARDFVDRILVFLINTSQSALAVHFSKFIGHASISSYLKARSLLIDGQSPEAATLFARTAYPLTLGAITKAETNLELKLQRGDAVEYFLHVATLFASINQHQHSLRFCQEALLASHSIEISQDRAQEIQQRNFSASLSAGDWTQAYNTIPETPATLRQENVRNFVIGVCESSKTELFTKLPFLDIMEDVDSTLEKTARNMFDVRAKPSYHKILYAFRIKHSDYRGAASIMYHRLQFLNNRSHVNGFNVADHLETTEGYLCIINALRCLPVDDAWFIAGTFEYAPTTKKVKHNNEEDEDQGKVKRQVLRLSDVKKAYDAVLHGLLVCLQELA